MASAVLADLVNLTSANGAKIIVNGVIIPVRQEIAIEFDPENGYTFQQRFAGASYVEMINLAQAFADAGVKYSFTFQNGLATLHVNDTTSQVTIDTWTVAQNELSKSALDNPLIKYNVSAADLITIAENLTGEIDYPTAKGKVTYSDPTTARLLDDIKKGSTDFAFSGYALRHTTNVGNRSTYNVADNNIDALYSLNQLLTETTDASLWTFPLPTRLNQKLQSIYIDFYTRYGAHTGFIWSFLKRGSTESTAANNRINITTEYWFDEWSTDRYQLAVL